MLNRALKPAATAHILCAWSRSRRQRSHLRRSLRTGLAQLGVFHEVAEMTIGHTLPSLVQTYNRHAYADERRAALQRWADHVARIVKADPAKVTPMRRKA